MEGTVLRRGRVARESRVLKRWVYTPHSTGEEAEARRGRVNFLELSCLETIQPPLQHNIGENEVKRGLGEGSPAQQFAVQIRDFHSSPRTRVKVEEGTDPQRCSLTSIAHGTPIQVHPEQ